MGALGTYSAHLGTLRGPCRLAQAHEVQNGSKLPAEGVKKKRISEPKRCKSFLKVSCKVESASKAAGFRKVSR